MPGAETYISASLWNKKVINKRKISILGSRRKHSCLFLLHAGNIEIQPGPEYMKELYNLLSKRGMKIFHPNVRGLLANIDHVKVLLNEHKNIDILTLSETHINTKAYTENPNLYHIPGYTFISRNRKTGLCGDVGMYISNRIKWKRRSDLEHRDLECIWIEIFQKNSKTFLVGSLY
ncbi:uncharacterized protein LOC130649536 [Hydractinia symbiolongicarpus]|uniref:uncharacterized protein LOC130649536 n=1 Tax=Hydractinia symbiolongicarpus TaxID=13093 RepID=UPI00254AA021|nr:uncharacterized protein LOC130649536 [Hydractinia symbiolongicarpus]